MKKSSGWGKWHSPKKRKGTARKLSPAEVAKRERYLREQRRIIGEQLRGQA